MHGNVRSWTKDLDSCLQHLTRQHVFVVKFFCSFDVFSPKSISIEVLSYILPTVTISMIVYQSPESNANVIW